ncbi:MAG TPA: LuxR C-terminal-related transcriptional regulator [Candidatus Eremiobacteraceae bacterium]
MKLGASPEATVAVDNRGIIVAWNDAAEQLLGWTARHALGKPCHEVMHGSTPAGAPVCSRDCAIVQLCREGKAARRFEMVANRPDGADVWLDVTTVTVDDEGQSVAVHVLCESVASRRMAAVAEDVAHRLANARPDAATEENAQPDLRRVLTPRELDVLQLLAAGLSTDNIGRQLGLSRATVRSHVQNLLPKLGVHSRIEAAVVALKAGLVHLH